MGGRAGLGVRVSALLAGVVTALVLGFHVALLARQGDSLPLWVLSLFVLASGASLLAAARPSAPALLTALGVTSLLTALSLLSLGPLLLPALVLLALASVLHLTSR